mmetsp:Transcript_29089/g.65879  ORF Transcript_29089/g.65879 Transcript_29089/m.65879 type:complete len:220 (-) Transcript_29089:72-731(-)
MLREEGREALQSLGCRGSPEADGVGEAGGMCTNAVMREPRREVQRVTSTEFTLEARHELGEHSHCQVGLTCLIRSASREGFDLPTSSPSALDKEHIIIVDVSADRTTWRRVADHDVIEPPVWEKIKTLSEVLDSWMECVDLLKEQCPATTRKFDKICSLEWPISKLPWLQASLLPNGPCQCTVLACHIHEILWLERAAMLQIRRRQHVPDEERPFLPIS